MDQIELAGERRPYAVLAIERLYQTPLEELVRERRSRGISYRKIAREFGVSHQTLLRNVRKRTDLTAV